MKIRLASPILKDSIVDGEGLRTVIWTQGCSHNCPGCHNPETHSFFEGVLIDVEDIKNDLDNQIIQDGITFSGGDPFFQIEPCIEIAKYAKEELGLNIWCYTGFVFEELINNPLAVEFLKYIDVLKDGKFEMDKKSYSTKFRGSTNQRLINVKQSLKDKKVHQIKKYDLKKKVITTRLFV